jgi:alkanesulfonate monooxygenase SsuD/methylene tetrahydromethanopterin reductase-like flavin-dependent oxidoreductase (luciferase family)
MLLNLYRPLRAFEEICMLDQLNGDRLDLGIGRRGALPRELWFFGVSPAEAQDRYSEAAEIVLKAMETDTLTYSGRHFSISDVPIRLSPIQKPYPPLWYGTSKPETARWAADNSINIACVGTSSAIRAVSDAYGAHWSTRLTRVMPLLRMVRIVVIARSDAEARALAGPAYAHWFRTFTFLLRIGNLLAQSTEVVRASFGRRLLSGRITFHGPGHAQERGHRGWCDIRHVPTSFGDLSLAASLQTVSATRSTVIPDFTSSSSLRV